MKIFKKLSCMLIFCIMCLSSNVFANKALNLTFVGSYGSGKTALIMEATGNSFDYLCRTSYQAKVVNHKNLRYFNEDIECYLHRIDTCNMNQSVFETQEQIIHSLGNADIAVIAVDMAGNAEFDFDSSFKIVGVINVIYPHLPVLLVATRIDDASESDMSELYKKSERLKNMFSDTCDFEWVATSAKERINLGSLTDSEDLGNNFWGRIRYMIKRRNMYDSLRENTEEIFSLDGANKQNGICVLV